VSKTPLLADFWPHGVVAKAYGVWNEEQGASTRAVFIVDEEGRVAWRKEYRPGIVPDIEEILAALTEL
jgi:alkyl hydroperoxide reductase subunit AhpC